MSIFKKVTSSIIAGAVALSLMVPFASASKLPNDVVGTKYEESVELLQALKVMVGDKDTGEFRLEDSIIRSEVAKIATGLAGLMGVAEGNTGKTVFPDVVDNHWANGYINVSSTQKFVVGDDVGTFRPDDEISFAEAVAIMVRVLGYEPSAVSNGGFPTGYLVVAAQNGLLKGGISKGPDEKATRGIVAQMAFNALTIDLMERTGFGNEEKYEIVDKTLLEDKLNVVKANGQVTANSETSLAGPSSLKSDQIAITDKENKNEIYKTSDAKAKEFIAQRVTFYYNDDKSTDDKTIILIRSDKSKNDILEVASSNIESVTGSDKKVIQYWVNKETDNKPEKATISSTVKTFYNGVSKDYNLDDLATLPSGGVRLLDTDRDGTFDFAFVTEYKNIVVDDVSATTFRVSDKYNLLTLILDPKDKGYQFEISKDDARIELKDIKEWDVLSVAMDGATQAESKVINVKVSDETVTGKVTEIEDEKVKIGDKLYEIAKNYKDAGLATIKLDDEGTFHLDIDGKIAAVDTVTMASGNYGYLMNTNVLTGLSDQLEFEIFNKSGERVVLKGATKVKVNKTYGLAPQAAADAIEAANNGNTAQLITFDVNSKNEITSVYTAKANTGGNPLKTEFSKDYASESGSLTYSATAKKLARYNLDKNTIVFDIPKSSTESEDYAVRNIDMFVDKTKYEVDIFDLADDLTAKIIVVKDSAGNTNAESPAAVVKRVTETQNADRVSVDKLYALVDGKEVTINAKDTDTLVKGNGKKIAPGDVIQYKTNSKGEIDKVTLLFDSENRASVDAEVYKDYEGTEMTTVLGKVTKKFSTSINVKTSNMPETNFSIEGAKIYNYDFSKSSGLQVSVADASDIIKYDEADPRKVFLRIYKGEVKEILIIKEK